MSRLHYLTVQDILWINLQLTKKVQHFNYAKLEEATYYQYAYGESNSLVPQAARFLGGFLKMHPFDAGNEATALVGCAAFLMINGHRFKINDDALLGWYKGVIEKRAANADDLGPKIEEIPDFHDELKPDVRNAIATAICDFPCSILELNQQAPSL